MAYMKQLDAYVHIHDNKLDTVYAHERCKVRVYEAGILTQYDDDSDYKQSESACQHSTVADACSTQNRLSQQIARELAFSFCTPCRRTDSTPLADDSI